MVNSFKLWKWALLFLLIFLTSLLWVIILDNSRLKPLQVSFLDVGQGDAIFIESPVGNQVLIDGGVGRGVLRVLGAEMPFYDRTLDLIIGTHPDADHIGGLSFVLDRYRVTGILTDQGQSDTEAFDLFNKASQQEEAKLIEGVNGTRISLGGGAVLDIIYPDVGLKASNTNDGAVVAVLRYGSNSFLLTGDISQSVENYLAQKFGSNIDIDVLKLAHHGSNTSSSDYFLQTTSPDWAVISAEKDSRYGHPHEEVLERLEAQEISYINTADEGTITFFSDGKSIACGKCK